MFLHRSRAHSSHDVQNKTGPKKMTDSKHPICPRCGSSSCAHVFSGFRKAISTLDAANRNMPVSNRPATVNRMSFEDAMAFTSKRYAKTIEYLR